MDQYKRQHFENSERKVTSDFYVSIIEMKILFDLGNVTLTVKQMCQCFDRVVEVCKCGKTVLGLKLVST